MRAVQPRGVMLVEGVSDRRAVETLARRRGRDLDAEGVTVVPMGGYGNLPRFLGQHREALIGGLYDIGEERHFLSALGCEDRAALERAGFYACTRDLEDELTRAVGPEGMRRVLAEHGDLSAFRTFQKQPAHRDRPLEEQLHGFMWNRKQKYAVLLVEALDLGRVPRPLDRLLAREPRQVPVAGDHFHCVRRDSTEASPKIGRLLPEGVHHWTARHPEWEGPVSAYAIDDGERLILIDPIAVPDDVRALFGSREVVTVLTSTWHERDAAALGFPV